MNDRKTYTINDRASGHANPWVTALISKCPCQLKGHSAGLTTESTEMMLLFQELQEQHELQV
jgi:hypothetical protein